MKPKLYAFLLAALLVSAGLFGCSQEAETPADDTSQVATSEDMAPAEELDLDGLVPVPASDLNDGTYAITVESSSSMFNIVDCELTVSNGTMTAAMTMSGTGYRYVYPGTAEQAAEADASTFIEPTENADGQHVFTLEIDALNSPVALAAFSDKKELWYDRTLVFSAESLPLDAFKEGVLTTIADLNLADGTYLIDVALEGGTGRASVESPTVLEVKNGTATALLTWSSANYDYMVIDDVIYDAVIVDEHSQFTIPVTVFDAPMAVVADTTAMSEPHEISYNLIFDSATIVEQ